VLEIGLEHSVLGDRPVDRYLGIDPSADVVERARSRRPGGEYAVGTLPQRPAEVEVTVGLDLLTREGDESAYRAKVATLWASTTVCLVVSGWEVPPGPGDPTARFHEPLSATLQHVAPDAEVYPLGSDSSGSLFAVLRAPSVRHPRDFSASTLRPLAERHPDALELIALRLHARTTTRFYPDHAPRLWEYPVVAAMIRDHLSPGSRLIDIGAGVTPLAPFLTGAGYVVDTVDPSPIVRTWPPQDDWNEWDFLDYGAAGLAHRSWHSTLADVPRHPLFDGAYSVSVIEHLPAADRRALLTDISYRVRKGGLVVLTIDLVRGEDALWNRNLGLQVEDPAAHGRMEDVIEEAAREGLELVHREIVRDWGDVDVDIGLVALRHGNDPPKRPRHSPGTELRSLVRRLRR
jgi:2-polyprenyl-3-methyl-5-hydroxy-6-metoxy-1,4-benzoquinol methylase